MGLVNRTETIYFERWHIPITILTNATSTPSAASTSSKAPKSTLGTVFPDIDDLSESYDHDKAFRSAYDQVTKSIFSIIEVKSNLSCIFLEQEVCADVGLLFQSVNHSTDHMPLSQYQYELQVLDAEESRRRSSASFSNKGPI